MSLLCTVILAIPLMGSSFVRAQSNWQSRFPYVHQLVPVRTAYQQLRTAETPLEGMRPLKMARYLRKMARKMRHSSHEVEEYFCVRNREACHELDLRKHYRFDELSENCRIGAVGDIMWMPCGTDDFIAPPLVDRLGQFDILFGNLETPVQPNQKPGMFQHGRLRFNAPTSLLNTLATGGRAECPGNVCDSLFDVLSVANNHALDRGPRGLAATAREVARFGILPVGVAQCLDPDEQSGRYVLVERCGCRIAFIAYTYGVNKLAWKGEPPPYLNALKLSKRGFAPDFRHFERTVAAARAQGAQFIVLSVHWGFEFEYYPHPHFMTLAREFAARGADLIVGHHAHVLQPMEILHVNIPEYAHTSHYVEDSLDPTPRVCLVAYSLGNFASTQPTGGCKLGGLLSITLTQAISRQTGAWRPIISDAEMKLVYSNTYLNLRMKRCVRVLDVDQVIASGPADGRLRCKIEKALIDADIHRIGAHWLRSSVSNSRTGSID